MANRKKLRCAGLLVAAVAALAVAAVPATAFNPQPDPPGRAWTFTSVLYDEMQQPLGTVDLRLTQVGVEDENFQAFGTAQFAPSPTPYTAVSILGPGGGQVVGVEDENQPSPDEVAQFTIDTMISAELALDIISRPGLYATAVYVDPSGNPVGTGALHLAGPPVPTER